MTVEDMLSLSLIEFMLGILQKKKGNMLQSHLLKLQDQLRLNEKSVILI